MADRNLMDPFQTTGFQKLDTSLSFADGIRKLGAHHIDNGTAQKMREQLQAEGRMLGVVGKQRNRKKAKRDPRRTRRC